MYKWRIIFIRMRLFKIGIREIKSVPSTYTKG